jgi:hypothetical protein
MSTTLGAIAFFAIMIAHVLAVIAIGRARVDADEAGTQAAARQRPICTDERSWHIWLPSS